MATEPNVVGLRTAHRAVVFLLNKCSQMLSLDLKKIKQLLLTALIFIVALLRTLSDAVEKQIGADLKVKRYLDTILDLIIPRIKSNSLRCKIDGEQGSNKSQDDDDCISKLPDEILISILCFLPTDEAVRLSVLSRRWQNLWMKVPRLEFYCKKRLPCTFRPLFEENNVKTRVNLVNQVTKLHEKETTTIEELTVGLPLGSKYSGDINQWVEFTATKHVKKLTFDFGIKQDVCLPEIPRCFPSNAGSLPYDGKPSYEIFLAAANMDNNVVGFDRLEDLNLTGVNVGDEAMESLLSNSRFLVRLRVTDSQKIERLVAGVCDVPNLKYLELRYCNSLKHLDVSAPNLVTLKLFNRCWFVHLNIDAPILFRASFNVYPDICDFFRYDKPKMLEEYGTPEMLHFDYIGKPRCMFGYLLKLLDQLSCANNRLALGLSSDAFGEICKAFDFDIPLPDMSKVEHLKINISPRRAWYIEGNMIHTGGDEPCLHYLWPLALVKAASSLQKLSIKLSDHEGIDSWRFGCKWLVNDDAPKNNVETFSGRLGHYSHVHLREVELHGFTGSRNEVEIVLYLVEVAAVSLEKIVIHVDQENQQWAQLLEVTHIPPHIHVVMKYS